CATTSAPSITSTASRPARANSTGRTSWERESTTFWSTAGGSAVSAGATSGEPNENTDLHARGGARACRAGGAAGAGLGAGAEGEAGGDRDAARARQHRIGEPRQGGARPPGGAPRREARGARREGGVLRAERRRYLSPLRHA